MTTTTSYPSKTRSIGAVHFYVKPLSISNAWQLKSFAANPNSRCPTTGSEYIEETRLWCTGTSEVWIVRRKSDGKKFAMKKIRQYLLKEKELKQAKEECSLLRVLSSPVILHYETSFEDFHNNCFCIVTELCPGGNRKISRF